MISFGQTGRPGDGLAQSKTDPLTYAQSEYSADHYVLRLEDGSGTNLSNTGLAAVFPED